ncbi:trypsin-like peptidase domain-containing protein [Melittangium boletus]|uniref:Serine protease n=1 Tax=Melittangium boletus DSM 14713 TaxID=1294270 RepID=A0A250IN92_9BACT|nr:trypsin-like peptidase domain-containing protein [Melittangium boletus]ATB32661.1 serine protease [Melittangium boletus DSM 14713]
MAPVLNSPVFRPWVRLAGLFVWLLAPAVWAEPDSLDAWLTARAREHAAWTEDSARSSGGAPGLWREWTSKEPMLPGFVPPSSLAPLIRAVEAGVVNISVTGEVGRGGTRSASGSGFLLTPEGLVVTNNHVVARGSEVASEIVVRLSDGREFQAEVVGRDASTDVALLRLLGREVRGLPAVYLGDSDQLEVGDWVVAIGNPFGLDHSVSHGMISAKERVIGVGPFDDFIQTDALINPGNSGGPLFNMRGEVVGVNTAIISEGQGIGFAVPSNMVKDLLPNLSKNGQLQRGWLGVVVDEQAQAGTRAAVVTHVYPHSPAEQAGLLPGDLLVGVNGKPVDSFPQLLRKVAMLVPETQVTLSLVREGTAREVRVKLTARPVQEGLSASGNLGEFGLVLRDITPVVGATLGLEPYAGVLVSGVVPRSPAAREGLRAGDVVIEVNRSRVRELRAVKAALEKSTGRTLLLRVQRGDVQQYVALEP